MSFMVAARVSSELSGEEKRLSSRTVPPNAMQRQMKACVWRRVGQQSKIRDMDIFRETDVTRWILTLVLNDMCCATGI